MDKSYEEMKRLVEERKIALEENNKLYSKQRLKDNIKTKIKTTMIGSIVAFEECFGELWGHKRDWEDLDDDEKYWREQWEKVRFDILNKGNRQIRNLDEEISEYTIKWNKYKIEFKGRFWDA